MVQAPESLFGLILIPRDTEGGRFVSQSKTTQTGKNALCKPHWNARFSFVLNGVSRVERICVVCIVTLFWHSLSLG